MKIFDSNIVIYAAKNEYAYLRPLLFSEDVRLSIVSKAETLGYHKLSDSERTFFENVFNL